MARIRTIKPEFWTSLSNARLSPFERLTFIGLWNHCDDSGRCVDSAHLIRATVWPVPTRMSDASERLHEVTAAQIEHALASMEKENKIIRYHAGEQRLIQVTNWRDHQVISRPTDSRYDPPEGYLPDGRPVGWQARRKRSNRDSELPYGD